MIVDTSAVVAIFKKESEGDRLLRAIAAAAHPRMSATSLVEAGIVAETMGGDVGSRDLDLLLFRLGVEIVAFTPDQAALARKAHRQFGKGRNPAGLNFGDCCVYALAKDTGEPLLFKGNDFTQTDIVAAPY